jgi:hypothetical protein
MRGNAILSCMIFFSCFTASIFANKVSRLHVTSTLLGLADVSVRVKVDIHCRNLWLCVSFNQQRYLTNQGV